MNMFTNLIRRHGTVAAMLALGLSSGLVAGSGCGTTSDTCVTDSDCTAGESCDAVLGTCSCDPTAAQDSCTVADSKTVCSETTKLCVSFCTTDANCTKGETCNTTTGVCGCVVGASPDACTVADSQAVCHLDSASCETTCVDDNGCASPNKCDPVKKVCRDPSKLVTDCTAVGAVTCPVSTHCAAASKACEADCTAAQCTALNLVCDGVTKECIQGGPATCASADLQPSSCESGEVCTANTCAPIPAATCSNITSHTPVSDFGTSGAIIYAIEKTGASEAASAFCGGLTRVKVTVSAYRKTGTFPATADQDGANLGLHQLESNGTASGASEIAKISSSAGNYSVTNGGKNAEIILNYCFSDATSSKTVGLFFTDGNGFCGTIAK